MKYFLLLALTITATAAFLTGCGSDVTHSHDIYRAQYNYKPLPQQDVAAPTPRPSAAIAPPTSG